MGRVGVVGRAGGDRFSFLAMWRISVGNDPFWEREGALGGGRVLPNQKVINPQANQIKA